jgi:hypothetical protein
MIQHTNIQYYYSAMQTSLYIVEFSASIMQATAEDTLYSSESMQFWPRIILQNRLSKWITLLIQMKHK